MFDRLIFFLAVVLVRANSSYCSFCHRVYGWVSTYL